MKWKSILEEAGVKVITNLEKKVHAKICSIRKKIDDHTVYYGFISTGNINEKTSLIYGDHCLLTANAAVMEDVNRVFSFLENPRHSQSVKNCRFLLISPFSMRKKIAALINKEIKNAAKKKEAAITLKMNSLSDEKLIDKLVWAAKNGVKIKLIIRGICCLLTQDKKYRKKIKAISIVDEYLEHARVFIFNNDNKERIYISSADWMVRNLDYRLEVACPVLDEEIKEELKDILAIQLSDNVKARILDNDQTNAYVPAAAEEKRVRSQEATYYYLLNKKYKEIETGRY